MVYVHVPCDKTVSLSLSTAGRRRIRIRIAGSGPGPGPGLLGFARYYPFPFDLPPSFLTALLAGKIEIDDLALWVSAEGRPDPVSPFMVKFPSPSSSRVRATPVSMTERCQMHGRRRQSAGRPSACGTSQVGRDAIVR